LTIRGLSSIFRGCWIANNPAAFLLAECQIARRHDQNAIGIDHEIDLVAANFFGGGLDLVSGNWSSTIKSAVFTDRHSNTPSPNRDIKPVGDFLVWDPALSKSQSKGT
jgi:hypothetical protein